MTDDATKKVTTDQLHEMNSKVHNIINKRLDAMIADMNLFDDKTLKLAETILNRNSIKAVEEDMRMLEAKRREVAATKALLNKKRENSSNLAFFEQLKERKYGTGDS